MSNAIDIQLTDRQKFVLAVLAIKSETISLTPVQVQKLFFLLDKKLPTQISRPLFDFEPYDYGPFDPAVYRELEHLSYNELVSVTPARSCRQYILTQQGLILGTELASSFPSDVKVYIARLVDFVSRLSFAELVSAIYKEFPDMKQKSIFRQ